MRVRIRTRVWFVTATAVAAIGILAAIVVWGIDRYRAADAWVEHAQEVMGVAAGARGSLLGAESAIRGYVLTGDPWLVSQFEAERTNVLAALAQIDALKVDDQAQQVRLDALKSAITGKLEFLAEQRQVFRDQGQAAAIRLTATGKGRELMNRAIELFSAFVSAERRLLAERQAQENDAVEEAETIALAGVAAIMIALVIATMLTSRALAAPIRLLASGIEAYSSGERAQRLQLKTSTEMDRIADAFDGLAQRLEHEEKRRLEADMELRAANQALRERTQELTEQTRIVAGLAHMAEQLQGALTREEIGAIVVRHGKTLLGEVQGSLLLMNPSRNELVELAAWNTIAERRAMVPEDCWGLRQGRAHLVQANDPNVVCPHLADAGHAWSLCVPLVAQGDVLGLMTVAPIDGGEGDDAHTQGEPGRAPGPSASLVTAMGEQIALGVAKQRLAETLRNQSIRDPLTDLFNRRFMEESLDREIARAVRLRGPVSVIMLDVDHFKRFNDSFGHDAGDAVLKAMGQIMRRSVRNSDIACRYGGEEFLIILHDMSLDEALQRAEQLRQSVRDATVVQGGRKLDRISISLGVATYPDHAVDRESLVTVADDALRHAKAEGRDRVVSAATLRAA